MYRRTSLLVLVLLAFACAGSSNGEGSGDDDDSACAPGRQVSCPCDDQRTGTQICNSDGNGYSECRCPTATGGTTGSGGAGGTAGVISIGGTTSTGGSGGDAAKCAALIQVATTCFDGFCQANVSVPFCQCWNLGQDIDVGSCQCIPLNLAAACDLINLDAFDPATYNCSAATNLVSGYCN